MYTPEMPLEPVEEHRRVVYNCDCCGEPIFEGEEYWDLVDCIYCADCIQNAHYYFAECDDVEEDLYIKTP